MPQKVGDRVYYPDDEPIEFISDEQEEIDFHPDEPKKEDKSLLRKGWDLLTNPIEERKTQGGFLDAARAIPDIASLIYQRPQDALEIAKGYGQGAWEGVKSFSPMDYIDTATGFGKASLASKAISAIVAAKGAQHLSEGNIFQGIAELAGGGAGALSRIKPKIKQPEVLPPLDISNIETVKQLNAPPTILPYKDPSGPIHFDPDLVNLEGFPKEGPLPQPKLLRAPSPEPTISKPPVESGLIPGTNEPNVLNVRPGTYPQLHEQLDQPSRVRDLFQYESERAPIFPGRQLERKIKEPSVLKRLFTEEEGSLNPKAIKEAFAKLVGSDNPKDIRRAIQVRVFQLDSLKAKDSEFAKLLPEKARKVPLRSGETYRQRLIEGMNSVASSRSVPGTVPIGQHSVDKLMEAIRSSRSVRQLQEQSYRQEKGIRFGKVKEVKTVGFKGYQERLGKMKGPYKKIEYEPVKIDERDADRLFSMVWNNKILDEGEKFSASSGLRKILGLTDEAPSVPQTNELEKLGEVIGRENIDELVNLYGALGIPPEGITVKGLKGANSFSKAVMSSNDVSGLFRQGLGLIYKKEYWKNVGYYFRAFKDEEVFNGVKGYLQDESFNKIKGNLKISRIKEEYRDMFKHEESGKTFYRVDPNKVTPNMLNKEITLKEIRDANDGLSLTDIATESEENFGSKLAEYFPGVKRSNRAYSAFLNKVRYDVYKSLVKDSGAANNPVQRRALAEFVNIATGRGSLGAKGEEYAGLLNLLFFSPRLQASRVKMFVQILNPKLPSGVRKEYIKSLASIVGFGTTLSYLSSMAGYDVVLDPTNADFGKIKIGETRMDPFAGIQQYAVAMARLMTQMKTSSVSGKTSYLNTGKYGASSSKDLLEQFSRSKASPVAGFVYDLFVQRTPSGKPFIASTETIDRMVQMIANDIWQVYQEDPKLIPLAVLAGATGFGVQTYDKKSIGQSFTDMLPEIEMPDLNPLNNR